MSTGFESVAPVIVPAAQLRVEPAAHLQRQEPFVNPTLANHALALLAKLFRHGSIEHHGEFVNVAASRV
jgi:hypothetical protein